LQQKSEKDVTNTSFNRDRQGMPQWEKEFIDKRLEMVVAHPERLQPIETLFI